MLNQQIGRGQVVAECFDPTNEAAEDRPAALKQQQYIGMRVRHIARQTMSALGHDPGELAARSLRQALVYLSGRYPGEESGRFAHYCRALQLMAQQQFRAALSAFDRVLVGQVEPAFEPIRRMALELHSVCLEELEFDDLSMEQFTQLMHRKFEETRANGQPDDVAIALGFGGL